MTLFYNCPECGEEVELQGEELEELNLYCYDCDYDFTEEYQQAIYEDFTGSQIDYYHGILEGDR